MRRIFRERESAASLGARGESLLAALDIVLDRRRWTRNQVRAFQTGALVALVKYAYERVPFYRAKYAAAGFHPSQVQSLDDLGKIPLLTKEELRQAPLHQLRNADDSPDARLLSSSGSTGVPGRLFYDDNALMYFTAQDTALYYDWCDRRPIRDGLYFLDLVPGSIDLALGELLRTTVPDERLLSSSKPPADLIASIKTFAPEFISSYPSTIRNIAITLRRQGATYENLRLLHLTSEMLDARTETLLRSAFPHARIVQTYTASEGGLMAWQCAPPQSSRHTPCAVAASVITPHAAIANGTRSAPATFEGRWHLAEDSGIYEIVDAGGRPTDDLGELVVTNLTNWATPIIRYRGLGDYCRWARGECPCGSDRRTIEQLEGRVAESLRLPDGALMTPFALTNALEEVPGIYQFQVIQAESGVLEVLFVPDTHAGTTDEAVCAAIRAAVEPLFATEFYIRNVDCIPCRLGSHKIPLVLSRSPGRLV